MLRSLHFHSSCAGVVLFVASLLVVAASAWGAGSEIIHPFQAADSFKPNNQIDVIVHNALRKKALEPANLCSDEVFIRRVFLDTTGTIPDAQEVRKFLDNPRSDKRVTLIHSLLKNKQFAEYGSLKWCDLLRVKAEFPINLWPNAVQAYHRWIQDAISYNMPYDQFVRELLTSSGSNFRVPQVNFYRAIQDHQPSTIAAAAAQTFMGVQFESLSERQQKGMEAFFSRVGYKTTAEWKEEIVYLDPSPADSVKAVFPDGTTATIEPGQDPRIVFADWLITAENPWFTRNIVNRIWSWLMGRGIIHEPDHIRPDNPPVYPELLSYLEKELVESEYDLQHIYQLILSSRTYQQSSIPQRKHPDNEKLFACYPVRQLEAEVLIDALCIISGTRENYSSLIPEPFTFIPPENRTISLADASITSQFLEMFGRPSRDTGLESERNNQPTESQRRHMLNSTHIQNKIERSWRVKQMVKQSRKNRAKSIDTVYLTVLSRYPTPQEKDVIKAYFQTEGQKTNLVVNDLIWALINSKEFLYRH